MEKPNVILLNWHDAGDWFGCYGNQHVNTPNVDRLAAAGVRFAHNHSACAICSPSRAAIATGKYCQNNGVMTLTNSVFQNRIHPDVPHMAARFKQLGYRSALFGIQHECAHEHVAEVMQVDEQFATDPWPNADIIRHYLKKWLLERQQDDTPFFAQIGTIDAHLNRFYSGNPPRDDEAYPPVQDTSNGLHMPGYLSNSEADQATVATLQGLLQRGDRLVGDMLDALDEAGLTDNTLIIMNVDHGVGLTRSKGTCYDPGITTAWIMRWPQKIPAGKVIHALSTHVDVLPTVWELLGHAAIEGLDGHSLAQHITGTETKEVHDYVYSHMVENFRSIRNQKWKLIRNFRPSAWTNRKGDCASQHKSYAFDRIQLPADICPSADTPAVELYDLETDPDELHNLSYNKEFQDQCTLLNDQLWKFLIEHDDFIIHETVNSPWQHATRLELEAYCAANNLKCPHGEGPLINAIDAASAAGTVHD